MPDDRAAIFRRFEVLKDLDGSALEDLARNCSWRSAAAGASIMLARESSDDVYFLTKGRVRVLLYSARDGKLVLFATLGPHEVFGIVSAIDGKPRAATAEVQEECTLASLPREQFLRLLQTHPVLALGVMKELTRRIRILGDRIYEFSTLAVRARVHGELLRLATLAEERGGQALLSPAPLLADFAARISTHREAVSRVLSRLQEQGILRRDGADIRLLDMERLRKLVKEEKGE
jgi:CRP/FNR family transcriptional regulator, cyclic AMP receptor protein